MVFGGNQKADWVRDFYKVEGVRKESEHFADVIHGWSRPCVLHYNQCILVRYGFCHSCMVRIPRNRFKEEPKNSEKM